MNPQEVYQLEKEKYAAELARLQKKQSRYGWLRLGIILVTAIAAYQVFQALGAWAWLVIFMGIGLFLWLVSIDADNNKKIKYLKALVLINEEELRMLQGEFAHRFGGAVYLPHEHAYAHDLDLFGHHSLYQLLNRCSGEQGRALLAHNLLYPLAPEEATRRQEAAAELAPLHGWRQAVQAHAAANTLTVATEKRLRHWLQQPNSALLHPAWRWAVPLYSTVACAVALAALLDLIPGGVFSVCFMSFIFFSFAVGKKATPTSAQLSGVVSELETLQQVLQSLEQPHFKSSLLVQLQRSIGIENKPASLQIKSLKDILNRFDLRLNVFLFIFLNSFLLWDVRQMRALNNWRDENSLAAKEWFNVVGLFEVMISLATLRFNKPAWTQPQFASEYFSFDATAIGHPLIKDEQRVTSDFSLQGRGRVALITGSNMAGKSTFLRSLGVNAVLAQMGAAVCADSLQLSPVQLLSSMRIADNLAENTSTFYAELKKLKTIIEAVQEHRPVFVLLDEILRGTNSLDRHTGSKALVRQLLREGSVAVLASHDVELAKLEEAYPEQLDNYHFDVQVEGQELYFDYKLKHGVCTNLNASVLMKKIGIEL
jgi:ABC-type Na+ transport system ATPase subunit NatA